jgi:glycosyltransferase involved in cell wall biosynthesis
MVTSDAGMFGELPEDVAARFPAGNADALTGKLRELLTDAERRRRAGEATLAHGASLDGWDKAAEQTEAAYLAAIARFKARA